MKKLLISLFVIGLLANLPIALAAPTLVNSCTAQNNGSNTGMGCTLGTVTAGDLIVIGLNIFINGGGSIVDTGGNSYATSSQLLWDGGAGTSLIYYAKNVTGGASFRVTSTYSASTFTFLSAAEYSGVASNPLDVTSTQALSSPAAGVFSSGTSTTSQAGDLIFGIGDCNDVPGVVSATSSFIVVATTSNACDITEYKVAGAAGPTSAVFNNSNGGGINVEAGMATFKASGSAALPTSDVTVIDAVTIKNSTTIQ